MLAFNLLVALSFVSLVAIFSVTDVDGALDSITFCNTHPTKTMTVSDSTGKTLCTIKPNSTCECKTSLITVSVKITIIGVLNVVAIILLTVLVAIALLLKVTGLLCVINFLLAFVYYTLLPFLKACISGLALPIKGLA